ncbi:hypothetical protein [Deinococcus petrolearius]|uniref:Uncharacterized protein n=1 Tax=Deinococcus petrolearius TaxID=1751295 RepID=A0ABW1DEI9_9DEIO
MSGDPLAGYDLTDPASAGPLLEVVRALDAERTVAYRALMAALPPELRDAVHALLDVASHRDRVTGVRLALQAQDGVRRAAAHMAQQKAESAAIRAARALKVKPRQVAPPPPAPPARVVVKPDWDYKPVEQPARKRGEVVTHSPLSVEVVARAVEELVRRRGPCQKPEVSAALPQNMRAYLSDAYRHLHSSRRVEVDGWQLRLWPSRGVR